jgi:hypothetical protein
MSITLLRLTQAFTRVQPELLWMHLCEVSNKRTVWITTRVSFSPKLLKHPFKSIGISLIFFGICWNFCVLTSRQQTIQIGAANSVWKILTSNESLQYEVFINTGSLYLNIWIDKFKLNFCLHPLLEKGSKFPGLNFHIFKQEQHLNFWRSTRLTKWMKILISVCQIVSCGVLFGVTPVTIIKSWNNFRSEFFAMNLWPGNRNGLLLK